MAFSGAWREIPEFKNLFEQAEAWKARFGIYKFIPDNGEGVDETGVVASLDEHLVWTLKALDTDVIEPGYFEGDWGSGGVDGWYLAELPWSSDNSQSIDAMTIIPCNVCEDGERADLEDCENCDGEGTIWMRLEDTGWTVQP